MTTEKREIKDQKRDDLPEIRVGDTIKVYYKFKEKDKERIQAFEGILISQRGSGISKTMIIRGPAAGVMMEKVIPVHSPNIQKIEIVKRGKVRRSKLYYLRGMIGKKAKLKRKIEKPISEKKEL